MKKRVVVKALSILGFVLLLSTSMQAATWIGAATSDVIDDDLTIDGAVELPVGPRTVHASSTDITVTLMNTPVVRGNDGGISQLYLCADAGQEICFVLDDADADLEFQGSSDGSLTPLLIVVGGLGRVKFQMRGSRSLTLNAIAGRGPVHMYLLMASPAGGSQPTIAFERDLAMELGTNVTVNVGADSLLSYLATAAPGVSTEEGTISFAPNNTSTGRMVVNIADGAGLVVAGHLTSEASKTAIDLTDIDRTLAAGNDARMVIANEAGTPANAHAGLVVQNGNAQCSEYLVDPFLHLEVRADVVDYNGLFSGIRFGYILGANATLDVGDDAYLDYIGTTGPKCPDVSAVPGFPGLFGTQLLKSRSASAFVVDGNLDPAATRARINLGTRSGFFLRSGVDNEDTVKDFTDPFPFTIDSEKETAGEGAVVMSVEGELDIFGSNAGDTLNSRIEVLSLFVEPTGGPLFLGGSETNFPSRTFDRDMGDLRQYNKAAILVNNCVSLWDAAIAHTDAIHQVCEKNDIKSEPTYIGGETHTLLNTVGRPRVSYYGSRLLMHTSAGVTGVDFQVPNRRDMGGNCIDNPVKFIFYSNGKRVDQGSGRHLNMGTLVGSRACDKCSVVSSDAHLDVVQTEDCAGGGAVHNLTLDVDVNDATLIEEVTGSIAGQNSVHTIYLGHSSNVCIGTSTVPSPFANPTTATMSIVGNFFSFESRGGPQGDPSTSNVTGQGGIFVDQDGVIEIDPNARASMSAMVTKSGNGVVTLPKSHVFFDCRVGIAEWNVDLSANQTLVPAGTVLSDYTFNWIKATKDYDNFCPFELGSISICACPTVEVENVTSLPTIQGEVGQLQLQGSRLGDAAHVAIDCGWVRELVFQKGVHSAEAPVGVVVLKNKGRVGLGSTHRNPDSLDASVVLGANGVTIVADGTGEVEINEDICINNICSILKGPNFVNGTDSVTFHSDCPKTIRVKKGGVLDLRSFDAGDIIRFTGELCMVLEPGARIVMDGATLQFEDSVKVFAEPFIKACDVFSAITLGAEDTGLDPNTATPAASPHHPLAPLTGFGTGLGNTDPFRVRLIGTGIINFTACSQFCIPLNAFVGVESLSETVGTQVCVINSTDLTLRFADLAKFHIGSEKQLGGAFQVGNVADLDHTVNFTLMMRGRSAEAVVESQGFLGLGVGIASKCPGAPDSWLVDATCNVGNITVDLGDGRVAHERTFIGSDPNASLIAVNNAGGTYTLILEDVPDQATDRANAATIAGGGNIVQITKDAGAGAGVIHPRVGTDDDNPLATAGGTSTRLRVGIMESRLIMEDDDQTAVAGSALFDFIKMNEIALESSGRGLFIGTAAKKNDRFADTRNPIIVGYVDQGAIGRSEQFDIGSLFGGQMEDRREKAAALGVVSVGLEDTSVAIPKPIRSLGTVS